MTLHEGRAYRRGAISIGPSDPVAIRLAEKSPDVAASVERWPDEALRRDDIYYFSIFDAGELVGQILLHDIDHPSGEALVAYHVFERSRRGRGIGATALTLLQEYVRAQSDLSRLVIITSADNVASRRVAEKCGFTYVGPPREDPSALLFAWDIGQ